MADDLVLRQLIAVVDSRTTVVCLHAAGQIRAVDEPFETLAGDFMQPPFHVHCRTLVVPWMPGMVNEFRKAANDELRNRPLKERRIGPNGEIGGRIPPPPPAAPTPPPEPPAPPSLPGGASMPPRAVKLRDDLDALPEDDWRAQPDPEKRAVAMWQWEYESMQAIEDIALNVEAGRDPFDGVELDEKWLKRKRRAWVKTDRGEDEIDDAYSDDEIRDFLYEAARVMIELVDRDSEEIPRLWRGMRTNGIPFSVGDVIDSEFVSFTTSENEAQVYTREADQFRSGDTRVLVVMKNARALPLKGSATGRMSQSDEHLYRGGLRVVDVSPGLGVVRVEVEPI